ncbi:MAG TPA: neutral zinc metallopeptidase [Candidatus Aminicenantes bacterium]|nr:neutral zinc metallopeptidase [Candidatus Aminicenantes bacterium]
MLWKGRRTSDNVEDRRGLTGRRVAVGGGLGAIAIAVIVLLLGGNPGEVMQNIQTAPPAGEEQAQALSQEDKELGEFVGVILADTEDVWNQVFRQAGEQYREPKLVLFTNATESACGYAQSATGPFYCSGDEKVYIDLGFFQEMQQRLGARGDFAWAYVIAHEVGHHVQNLLGVMQQANERMQASSSQEEANRILVRLELQADFLAGVWAHHAQRMKNLLEQGDIEEGLNAASSVGDDRIMKQQQGYVVPDAFTHGTSEQRVRWFTKGLKTGDIQQGDTFSVPYERL